MTGEGEFSNANQLLMLREERHDGQEKRDDVNDAKLKELVTYLNSTDRSLILRAKNTGVWLNVRGTVVTGTLLAAT